MIKLYAWPTPNAFKISIFLEEAEMPYEIVPVDITQGDQFSDAFLKISPNNRMPAIVDDDITVFESGAILIYLAEKADRFLPKEPRARIQTIEWLMWQVANVGPMFGQAAHFVRYAKDKSAYATERYMNETKRLMVVLDERLEGRDFICDAYSIADMATFPWVRLTRSAFGGFDAFPFVKTWVERLEARPGVARGMAIMQDLKRKTPLDEDARTVLFGTRRVANHAARRGHAG